jgi:hypothetical protein
MDARRFARRWRCLAGTEEGAGLGVTIDRMRQMVDEARAPREHGPASERVVGKTLVAWSEALDAVSDAPVGGPHRDDGREFSKLWQTREDETPIERPADVATGAMGAPRGARRTRPQWFTSRRIAS